MSAAWALGALMFSAALCAAALATPLQFESPGGRLEQLLPELSKISGVSLKADARTSEDVLAVRMDGKSLDWFMERAAWVSGGEWRQTPEGWVLERTSAQEANLIRQAAKDQADVTMADIDKALDLMPRAFELFMQMKEEEAMQLMMTAFDDPDAWNDIFEQAMMAEVIKVLGPQSLFTMPVGQSMRFAAKPNRLERPLTPAMRDAMQQVVNRMQSIMKMSLMMDESMRQPEILALLNRTPSLEGASINISRTSNEVSVTALTGESGEGGMMDMGLTGPMSVIFDLTPRRSPAVGSHPFGSEKVQPVQDWADNLKPEDLIQRTVDEEPLAKAAGAPMLAAAAKAGQSFVAFLPDSLLRAEQSFFIDSSVAIGELEGVQEVRGLSIPQAPENPGLAAQFEWNDGAGRPWALGRAIEARFSRKAMGDLLRRHLAQKEGIVTAAMSVLGQVRPAAWGGAYCSLIESAAPWLSQSEGLSQIGRGYAFSQFLASLPRGVLKSLTREPMTRFDPGMITRAEAALINSSDVSVDAFGAPNDFESPMSGFAIAGGFGESARSALGKVQPGMASFRLSGTAAGQVLAYNARTGQLEVLAPEDLGNALGSAENPEQADMRIHMPDYRSFSMIEESFWSLSAQVQAQGEQPVEVTTVLRDVQPPAGALAGLNGLPKSVRDRIESSRAIARGGGGQP